MSNRNITIDASIYRSDGALVHTESFVTESDRQTLDSSIDTSYHYLRFDNDFVMNKISTIKFIDHDAPTGINSYSMTITFYRGLVQDSMTYTVNLSISKNKIYAKEVELVNMTPQEA